MKRALLLLLLPVCGCASYTRAKLDLTAQVQRGIRLTREATASRQMLIDRLADAQTGKLDSAFDADVRQRGTLTADWVIAHRKAYIAARDAMQEQRRSLLNGQKTIESNLDAIDAALRELQSMHAAEMKLTLPEVTHGK